MTHTELTRQIEETDYLAEKLAAHMALFDAYYNDKYGIEQAALDPETYYTSLSDIVAQANALADATKKSVDAAHGRKG